MSLNITTFILTIIMAIIGLQFFRSYVEMLFREFKSILRVFQANKVFENTEHANKPINEKIKLLNLQQYKQKSNETIQGKNK